MKEIPCKEVQVTDNNTNNRLISENQHSVLTGLFSEASKITKDTPQKEICTLLSKTANYIMWNNLFSSDAHQLQVKLSACLTSKYNGCSSGFEELTEFIESSDYLE